LGGPAAQAAFRRHGIRHDRGSLDHQARDDKVCCNLVSVELTSTMSLNALVANRAPQGNPRMSRPVSGWLGARIWTDRHQEVAR
jgi:hypothetical protein